MGGGCRCCSEAPHYIHEPKTPYICHLQQDKAPKITPSSELIRYPDPWENQYSPRNPVSLYSSCLLYDTKCVSGKCSVPIYETVLGEPRPAFLGQPTMGSSGVPDLEDLPPYSLPPRPKVRTWRDWWEDFTACFRREKELEEDPCGEPISLTPDQVEGEVLRLKLIQQEPRFSHPLVEKLGHRTSFSPKDIPKPFFPKAKYYDEKPIPPPPKLTILEGFFHKEPKMEWVFPKSNPRAKVMTFQEVCNSICDALVLPPRFECATREPNLVLTGIPAPYFSQCTPQSCPCPPVTHPFVNLEKCASDAKPSPPKTSTLLAQLTPCGRCRTSVSPSLEKPTPAQPPPPPPLCGPQMIHGMQQPYPPTSMMGKPTGTFPTTPIMVTATAIPPGHTLVPPTPCPPPPCPPPPPPPPRMVCGGSTPLDDMPMPFYSECREPVCATPEPCYEEPTEQPCDIDRCKKTDFYSEPGESETDDVMPQPFYSQCPPKQLKKFEEADK